MQVVVISGLSGSGKSVALKVLEDADFYCIDNLPARFVLDIVQFLAPQDEDKISLSIDVRSRKGVEHLPTVMQQLSDQGADVRLLFLDAKTETLVKRFSETRRPHPLAGEGRALTDCIELERRVLEDISELGHRIDTSDLRPNTLRAWVRDFIGLNPGQLTLYFKSFGYKNSIPLDADFVFDVRCLPNPYYDPLLRPLSGKDAPVIAFLEADAASQKMLADIHRFIADWIPAFVRDNRRSLSVAIGCTGGQHRSVYFAERLAALFALEQQVSVRHRELNT